MLALALIAQAAADPPAAAGGFAGLTPDPLAGTGYSSEHGSAQTPPHRPTPPSLAEPQPAL